MAAVKVSASIVSYGGFDDVVQCVESLLENTKGSDLEIYLIDNASPDGTGARLYEKYNGYENITVIQNEKNLGYGKGHNACLPMIKSDVHFVVNPDIKIDTDALSQTAQWLMRNTDVSIVTPRLLFLNGDVQNIAKRTPSVMALFARQLPFKFLKKYENYYLMLDKDLTVPTEVQFCSGCFFAMPASVFKKIGGFDEKYFMYVEDADITRKAMAEGKAMYLPQVYVYHAWNRKTRRSAKHFFMQIKSMLRYFKKWGFRWGFKDYCS